MDPKYPAIISETFFLNLGLSYLRFVFHAIYFIMAVEGKGEQRINIWHIQGQRARSPRINYVTLSGKLTATLLLPVESTTSHQY